MNSKVLYIIGLLLIFQNTGKGQIKILNTSLVNPDTNLVYIDVQNFIQITGTDNLTNFKCSINGVEQKLYKNGTFVLRASAKTSTYQVKLSRGAKILEEKTYQSSIILEPKAGLGTKCFGDTVLSIPEIIANNKIHIEIPNCLFHFYMRVDRFDFSIYSNGKIIYSVIIYGNSLRQIELDLLKGLKHGDSIKFENIRASGPEDARIKKEFFNIEVK
jgi:hypothetical protein